MFERLKRTEPQPIVSEYQVLCKFLHHSIELEKMHYWANQSNVFWQKEMLKKIMLSRNFADLLHALHQIIRYCPHDPIVRTLNEYGPGGLSAAQYLPGIKVEESFALITVNLIQHADATRMAHKYPSYTVWEEAKINKMFTKARNGLYAHPVSQVNLGASEIQEIPVMFKAKAKL